MTAHDHVGRDALSEEAVERLIEALVRGEVVTEDDPLVGVATAVRRLASEPLPPETRARHLAAIHGSSPPLPARPRLPLRARFAAWATGLTAAATMASGAVVAAADPAAPGDRLYGIDRAVERVLLLLETDPDGDARLRLRFAEERVLELKEDDSKQSERLLAEAVREAGKAAPDEAAQAVATLAALLSDGVPDEARVPIARACLRIAEQHDVDADVSVCRLAIATAPE
ncbi:MAG: DUF5667 domain-containing protein, partial [Actinomycetota bacterium]|nr:DUF5667 domain-containing protein [Actinomycetota bacterium]